MKKLAAVLALILTSFVVAPGLVAPAAGAEDDPYTAGIRTSCNLSVPAVVTAGHAPKIRVYVRPNSASGAAGARSDRAAARAEMPTGTVSIRITKSGTSIFTRTVPYRGTPVTIQGPVLTELGGYVVHARFRTADGTVFKSCHNNAAFDVRSDRDGPGPGPGPGPNPGPHHPDGLLPDTGGPNLWWLILGLVLVGSGGGLVYVAKRQPSGPLYNV